MGYSASLAGIATLIIGLLLQGEFASRDNLAVLRVFIVVAGLLWLLAFGAFFAISEPAGATEGGGNALTEALRSLRLIIDDKPFRRYVISRVLLLSVALVIPFYVILAQQWLEGQLALLGWLIIANGLAGSVSAAIVGRLADRSSRNVMAGAAMLAGLVGVLTWYVGYFHADLSLGVATVVVVFFLITLAHGAVRLGRKVYLVDMASNQNRAKYVAVSNTIIGIAMLPAGVVGVIADILDVQSVILLLSTIAWVAGIYIMRLRDVSG
jgi:predicted MFS family arabinose efflux permease